jgi:hypothetical protein
MGVIGLLHGKTDMRLAVPGTGIVFVMADSRVELQGPFISLLIFPPALWRILLLFLSTSARQHTAQSRPAAAPSMEASLYRIQYRINFEKGRSRADGNLQIERQPIFPAIDIR